MGRARSSAEAGGGDYYTSLVARLRVIERDHSQAEMVRKTGVSSNNVSRYLHGTKPPVDFCHALAREFGIDPGWLLMGKGTPYLADVTVSTQETASNLLSLVNAMAAVSRLKAGAVLANKDSKVLRELNDALTRYEELKIGLHDQTRPVYEQLLDDLGKLVDERKTDQARGLEQTILQVGRLCDDQDLHLRFDVLRGIIQQYAGRYDLSLDYARNVFLRSLSGNRGLGEEFALRAWQLIHALQTTGYVREAGRICKAALALIEDANLADEWPLRFEWYLLYCRAATGDFAGVAARAFELFPRLPPDAAGRPGIVLHIFLMAGVMNVNEAIAYGADDSTKADVLARFAAWLEDEAALHAARAYMTRLPHDPSTAGTWDYDAVRIECLLAAFAGQGAAALERFDREARQANDASLTNPSGRLARPIHLAQLARLAGNTAKAIRWTLEAEELRTTLPADITTNPLTLGVHYRGALELALLKRPSVALRDLAQRARRYFVDMNTRGYHCFSALAQRHGPSAQ